MPRKKRASEPQPTDAEHMAAGDASRNETCAERPTERTEPGTLDPATEFDPAKLERPAPEGAVSEPEPRRQFQPDPFPMEVISLGEGNDAPKMRLFRNNRFQQMAIRFDIKPDPKYTEMLRDAGFRWRGADGVWTKQLDPEAKWRTQADSERLFRDIGNSVRTDHGLEPVQIIGM